MKKVVMIVLGMLVMAGWTNIAQAQIKVGYVNSDRILGEYDEAKEAQSKLDIEAKKLEDEYRGMLAKLDSLQKDYERQKMMMSETRRKTKEAEVAQLQESIQKYQVEKLGPEGEIYKKQAELVSPILEKVKKVIEKVGKDNKYDYIFDTVQGNILYAEPAHDLTDKVIYELKRTK
ncbi:MAG: OmpH family outer membrane protein [Candidatus Neomarinimicrobiota bacterium]